ncbi:ATP-dependent endonuclease [Rossellomorea sp. KS-H15a]|uniref:ATP-dependent nuclease n=1 Tax=Rossellomorea sp. KS-H15a TaxID=2963940 RepID=UPI0020C5CE63|nr:AAA family ATPase [Rossellomorea sp. KS-H15a]UTE76760.1 ATP-binding protein [Rossellomorea sp. KS-H15a]
MRSAKVNDHWRRTYARTFPNKLSSIKYENIPSMGSGVINFNGGITAICGINGAGKTTLLSAILGILNPDYIKNSNVHLLKIRESTITGQLILNNQPTSRSLTINDSQITITPDLDQMNSVWIDISSYSNEMIDLFQDMDNLGELLAQHEPRSSSHEEIELISYITGKTYNSILTYEVEVESDKLVPYFTVNCDGISYGSELMGAGEISVFFILWQLHRLSKNSILIVEEPETFLSPHAQEAILNVFAKYSEEKGIWVILSTHSPNILSKIPPQHVKLISRLRNDVKIIVPQDQSYLTSLGIPLSKIGILFVEDRAAREFSKVWISRYGPQLISQLEIKDIDSESKIKEILNGFPALDRWLKIIGVFDADQSECINETYNWPYTFLPGEKSPEEELRESAYSNPEFLSSLLYRTPEVVHMILSEIDGLNHHDWLVEFHKKLGLTYEQLVFVLFETWHDFEGNSELAKKSFDDLVELLNI